MECQRLIRRPWVLFKCGVFLWSHGHVPPLNMKWHPVDQTPFTLSMYLPLCYHAGVWCLTAVSQWSLLTVSALPARWESVVAQAAGSLLCRWPFSTWWIFLKVGLSPVTLLPLLSSLSQLWFLFLQSLLPLFVLLSFTGWVCCVGLGTLQEDFPQVCCLEYLLTMSCFLPQKSHCFCFSLCLSFYLSVMFLLSHFR